MAESDSAALHQFDGRLCEVLALLDKAEPYGSIHKVVKDLLAENDEQGSLPTLDDVAAHWRLDVGLDGPLRFQFPRSVPRLSDSQRDALGQVCMAMGRFLFLEESGEANPFHRKRRATELAETLRGYLALRGYGVEAKLEEIPDVEPRSGDKPASYDSLVSLQQAAGMVRKSKRTLQLWIKDDESFPAPEVEGGGGKTALWRWSAIREYLAKKTGVRLPERFPADPLHPEYGRVDD